MDAVVVVDTSAEDVGADAANNAEEVDTATQIATIHILMLSVKLPAQTIILQPHLQT